MFDCGTCQNDKTCVWSEASKLCKSSGDPSVSHRLACPKESKPSLVQLSRPKPIPTHQILPSPIQFGQPKPKPTHQSQSKPVHQILPKPTLPFRPKPTPVQQSQTKPAKENMVDQTMPQITWQWKPPFHTHTFQPKFYPRPNRFIYHPRILHPMVQSTPFHHGMFPLVRQYPALMAG